MSKPTDMIVYDGSLRPSQNRSAIRKFADMVTAGLATDALRSAERSVGVGPVAATLHTIRANGEGGIVGGLLGVVSGMGGLDRKGVPVDLAASGVSALAGIFFCNHELGITCRQASASAMTIFAFRKTEEWLGVRKKASFGGDDWNDPNVITTDPEIDIGADPIMQAAQAL